MRETLVVKFRAQGRRQGLLVMNHSPSIFIIIFCLSFGTSTGVKGAKTYPFELCNCFWATWLHSIKNNYRPLRDMFLRLLFVSELLDYIPLDHFAFSEAFICKRDWLAPFYRLCVGNIHSKASHVSLLWTGWHSNGNSTSLAI